MQQKPSIKCPNCSSNNIVKAGKKHLKQQTAQRYKCSSCNKFFSDKQLKYKTYNPKIILNAISIYNLGNTLEQTKNTIAKKFKTPVPITTLQSWIKGYSGICTYARIRKQAIKLYAPEEIIFSHNLQHNQIYKYQLHKAKLHLSSKELPEQKFQLLKSYIEKIPTQEFPHHIFQPKQSMAELTRSSQLKFQTLNFIKKEKQNQANQLVKLALNLANNNKQRHEAIQNFMITNDSTTIATEVPVYLTNDDIKYFKSRGFVINFEYHQTPITGHIDILQVRNGLIHILDYKPEADKIDAVHQLTMYTLALASRTKLALKDFKCAWFDESNYFEFFPLHAVYEKQ